MPLKKAPARHIAIGDIHGQRDLFDSLLQSIQLRPNDTLVLLGDLIDRGPQSKEVIDLCLELQAKQRVITLRGNHEVMMLEARKDREALINWLPNGGTATLDSYGAKSFDDVPPEHWEFLEHTLPYYECPTHFFVHAGADPELSLQDQPDYVLYWEFFNDPGPHVSGKTMICGHSTQSSGIPCNIGHAACVDTLGEDGQGWLTALAVETGEVWQVNQQGESRHDALAAFLDN